MSKDATPMAYPNSEMSTGDYLAAFSQSTIKQMDLLTKAPRDTISAKVKKMKISEISEATKTFIQYYPEADTLFSSFLTDALEKTTGSSEITASQLLQAYDIAVTEVMKVTSNNFRQLMMMGLTVGNFLDYFDVPINEDIVTRLEVENPELAEKYKARARRWVGEN